MVDNISGRKVVSAYLLGIKPKAKSDLAVTEISNVSDTLNPFDVVGQILVKIPTNCLHRILSFGGIFVDEVINKQN